MIAATAGAELQQIHLHLHTGEPQPWAFTVYRAINGLLSFFMWLLLLVVVLLLMVHLLWLGGGVAVSTAVDQGTRYQARLHWAHHH